MAKPTPPSLARVVGLRRKDGRPPGLAHVTLLSFGNLEERPGGFVRLLLGKMEGFEARAFHVAFDRIIERPCVTLRSRKTLQAAKAFQVGLANHLIARGFASFEKLPEAHLTLNYGRDGLGTEVIRPIEWCVDEVLLIESVHGQARHIVRGRWQLNPLLI